MKIISWNVNGIRAAERKGLLYWMAQEQPDVLGIQEIKAQEDQLSEDLIKPDGYHSYFNPAERKGYSGTGLYSKSEPKNVANGFGIPAYDSEGRVQAADYGDFIFFNIYFPNGKMNPERLQYKLDFYNDILSHFNELVSQGKKVLIAGDYNTAHKEIDLARPKDNEKISGFLPIEREWIDNLVEHGFVDCFRSFNQEPNNYTWWSMRSGARERNVGWRIDYFFCSANMRSMIKNCWHLPEVQGSDHCPLAVELAQS